MPMARVEQTNGLPMRIGHELDRHGGGKAREGCPFSARLTHQVVLVVAQPAAGVLPGTP